MATLHGAGGALLAARFLDAFPPSALSAEDPSATATTDADVPAGPVGTEEELASLALVSDALTRKPAGLTLPELRLVLGDRSRVLQRALTIGIRAKQLRRSGSRNLVRYVLNV